EEIKWIHAQPNEPVWAEIRELKPSSAPTRRCCRRRRRRRTSQRCCCTRVPTTAMRTKTGSRDSRPGSVASTPPWDSWRSTTTTSVREPRRRG
uniref:Uncharacterized protein n=1 Tax=Triticum urartu TaxID=4572 RepID=A0A8R7QU92_TRIUA